jgi:hypothetical protein
MAFASKQASWSSDWSSSTHWPKGWSRHHRWLLDESGSACPLIAGKEPWLFHLSCSGGFLLAGTTTGQVRVDCSLEQLNAVLMSEHYGFLTLQIANHCAVF